MNVNLKTYMSMIEGVNLTPSIEPESIPVEGGYVSDLLSDVMGGAPANSVWITIMRHLNVIAVAALAGIPAVVFPKNIRPDKMVLDKAIEENVCLVTSPLSAYEVTGRLYKLLNP